MDKILNAYQSDLIGKEFIYLSKYGSETRGIIENIHITHTMNSDINLNNAMQYLVDQSVKGSKTMEKPEKVDVPKWIGYRPEISIISTTGNVYNINEIYIIINE
jgi:hypothetical protein